MGSGGIGGAVAEEGEDGSRIRGREHYSSSAENASSPVKHGYEDEELSTVDEDGSVINAIFTPSSTSTRPRPLPPWTSQTFRVSGLFRQRECWWEYSAAEILLSSLGFFAVTTGDDCLIRVRTFGGVGNSKTGKPGTGEPGSGMRVGDSILLPDIFQLKGVRGKKIQPGDGKGLHWTPFFDTKKPYF